jgi:hypothetical protein
MSDDGEFDMLEWINLTKLSESGAKKLDTAQILDLETLLLVREGDIDSLRLSFADALRFREGIARLHAVSDIPPKLVDDTGRPSKVIPEPEKQSGKDEKDQKVYSLRDVERLLAGNKAIEAAGSIVPVSSGVNSALASSLLALIGGAEQPKPTNDALSSLMSLLAKSSGSNSSQVRELMRDILNTDGIPVNARGEKTLLPIHFVSCIRGTQDADELIHQGKGLNLVLQASTKRVIPKKLTCGQWMGANARILEKLISSGRLTPAQTVDYLDYNRKIGDLLQLYQPGSVFILDHNHRIEVNENDDRRWCDIDATLQNAHLKRKDSQQTDGSVAKNNASSGNVHRRFPRRGACYAYNSAEGCPVGKDRCRYEHVDTGDRSARSSGANERAPRFQKNFANTDSH